MNEKTIEKLAIATFVGALITGFGLLGVLIYVGLHFLSKVW